MFVYDEHRTRSFHSIQYCEADALYSFGKYFTFKWIHSLHVYPFKTTKPREWEEKKGSHCGQPKIEKLLLCKIPLLS